MQALWFFFLEKIVFIKGNDMEVWTGTGIKEDEEGDDEEEKIKSEWHACVLTYISVILDVIGDLMRFPLSWE